jgi:uncharacterized damage-inducible protein DinB
MAQNQMPSPKEQFLDSYETEHATTMRVLRAYPTDKLDLKPHQMCKSAKDLAWVFVIERGLGTLVFNRQFPPKDGGGSGMAAPDSWDEVLGALEQQHKAFGDLIRSTPDDQLHENVTFFTGPKQMGEISRLQLIWFLLMDQIHHRGQFSIYLRMAGGKVPSIYGPTADEPWM